MSGAYHTKIDFSDFDKVEGLQDEIEDDGRTMDDGSSLQLSSVLCFARVHSGCIVDLHFLAVRSPSITLHCRLEEPWDTTGLAAVLRNHVVVVEESIGTRSSQIPTGNDARRL